MAKQNRFGQSTPFDKESFRKVRDCFIADSHRAIFCLAWYTTERWGALLKLKVSDVYDESGRPRRCITIPATVRKDRQTREVPVTKALERELKAYRAALDAVYKKDGVPTMPHMWLFPSQVRAGQHLTMRAASRALERALKRADMKGLGYSTHSTRRGSITEMSKAGLAVPVIKSITGHRSLASLGRYIDVSDQQRAHAVAVLE
jgi:integrase/recombinase XerD